MEFFELTAADITALGDGQLRELVARLAEAELRQQELPRSNVHAGGAQEAADGGLDVSVVSSQTLTRPNFVPRANTGFQVKKHSMGRASCKNEMLDRNKLKASIKALADAKGAYIIVSGKDSCSATMYAERIAGMNEALTELRDDHELVVDFYGCDRLALWLRDHPGVGLWARAQLGKPLAGWRPYGRWAATPPADGDEFLADAHPCVTDGNSSARAPIPVLEGIQLARERLQSGARAVRVTGLSGVGKTRFAQALFEEDVGEHALPATDVLYADLGEELSPSASAVVTYLIANRMTSYVVLDNCPPDTHRSLQKQLSASSARLHLLTIEYDISDDRPEETDVIHIEPSSAEMVAKLVLRRFTGLNRFNAERIAEFAGGNARMALALADRVDADETLASFTDEDLFRRLFSQRKGESADLLRGATVLSLVYSFNVSRTEHVDELGVLGEVSGIPRSSLQHDQTELLSRQLAQKRGNWRAVLPHALATRLAKRALLEYEPEDINRELFKPENIRLLQSCAHRLGYLHDNARARELALKWVEPGAPLANIGACHEAHLVVLDHVAPVFPDVVLRAIEDAAKNPGFADRENPNAQWFAKLLSNLAYEDATFDRAVGVLLKFALTERHGENNNSIVGRLRQLFSLHLSGTMASPVRRQAFVGRLLVSGGAREREIAGELLRAAFEAHSWTAFGGFQFGAHKRGPGWSPSTEAERLGWYNGFITLIQPLLDVDPVSREWAKSIIARHFRGLWSFAGCVEVLDSLVTANATGGKWPEVWLAIGKTIEFDGSELYPDMLARLESLQALAAPIDVESEIIAYSFVDEWSIPGHKELGYEAATEALRDRVHSLGKVLLNRPELFNRLAPKIWAFHFSQVAWLGEGFASAAIDPGLIIDQVVASFVEHSSDKPSIAFLEGCIAVIHKTNPSSVPDVLERLLKQPKLMPFAVSLLVMSPITPWASAKLVEFARRGDIPAAQFEVVKYGWRHKPISDPDFAALLDAVSGLPSGYLSAIQMIVMRLHGKDDWNYKPRPEIFASTRTAVGHLLRHRCDNMNTTALYGLGPILAEALGPGSPIEEVQSLIDTFCEGLRDYRLSFLDLSEVAIAFIRARPEMLLDALFSRGGKESELSEWMFRRLSGHPAPSLNYASIDRLLAWCGSDARRIEFVARNLRVYESGGVDQDWGDSSAPVVISGHFKALLAAMPDMRPLIDIACDQVTPMSWTNSRVPIMETRSQALRDLLNDSSPELKTFVGEKLIWLEGRIERERAFEESQQHQREQRFE